MTRYVVGFMFDPKNYGVLLIQKNRPEWQKGKLNGIGGKVEPKETALQAMRREFKEETGINHKDWRYVITMYGDKWEVYVYTATSYDVHSFKQMEDEIPLYIGLHELDDFNLISNLYWLIPMCLDIKEINYNIGTPGRVVGMIDKVK